MTPLVSFDPVTVRTADLAQCDLGLRLGDALAVADVQVLHVSDMIEVQRDGTCVVAAIDAPSRDLVVIKPSPDRGRASVRLRVDGLSVSGSGKARGTPVLGFHGVIRPGCPGGVPTPARAGRGAIPLSREDRSADPAGPGSFGGVFPGGHDPMVLATDLIYPCRRDIFAATYEPVEEA